jgi:hypothetical protein
MTFPVYVSFAWAIFIGVPAFFYFMQNRRSSVLLIVAVRMTVLSSKELFSGMSLLLGSFAAFFFGII